jgi:hypothetical protein
MKRLKYSFIAAWTIYFSWFWTHAITRNSDGAIVAGHANLWGDWAAHFMMGSSMAYRHLLLSKSPFLLDAPFRYPFVADLLSALLIRAGVPFFAAFLWPSFLLSIGSVLALYCFYRMILGSEEMAITSSLIFLFTGGLGFLFMLSPAKNFHEILSFLVVPPTELTWRPVNDIFLTTPLVGMIFPQRAFALGFPIALYLLVRCAKHLRLAPEASSENNPLSWSEAAGLGLLWGFLPIVHTHTFLCVSLLLGLWFISAGVEHRGAFPDRGRWTLMIAIAVPIATLLCWHYFRSSEGQLPAPRYQPGWLTPKLGPQWIWFWIKNWSVTPLLAVIGVFVLMRSDDPRNHRRAWILGSLFSFFVMGNIFIFQPWLWDNTKIFLWAQLGASGLAAAVCHKLWKARRALSRPRLTRIAVSLVGTVLFLSMTASGALETYRMMIPSLNSVQMYTQEEIELAGWVKEHTPPSAVWLTAFYHNHWLFSLTGRQPLLSYEGWLWTHGYNYLEQKTAANAMFAKPLESLSLFDAFRIDYAVIGPIERRDNHARDVEFSRLFTPVLRTANYTLYATDRAHRQAGVEAKIPFFPAIPADVLKNLRAGLLCQIFTGTSGIGKPSREETAATLPSFRFNSDEPRTFPRPCFMTWDGYLKTDQTGIHRFVLSSDDGSTLSIDGKLVNDNGGVHQVREKLSIVSLEKGYHRIRVTYFDEGGGAEFHFHWAAPGDNLGSIPANRLFRD